MSQMNATLSGPEYQEFQGSRVANVPERPGLYAWYYRPASLSREVTVETLSRFFSAESSVTTQINHRYGMRMIARGMGEVFFGLEEQPVKEALSHAFSQAESFLEWFFRHRQFVHFCRPVYIGIAKNLYDRVYRQHLLSLIEYWDDTSRVSRYLSANSEASVQGVMDGLDLPHSFALEARVRGISSTDLMVSVLPTDDVPAGLGSDDAPETATRRALERLLQLLSDPICGRR